MAKGLLQELRGERGLRRIKNSASEQLCGFRLGSQGLWARLLHSTRIINLGGSRAAVRTQGLMYVDCKVLHTVSMGCIPFQVWRGAVSRTDLSMACKWLPTTGAHKNVLSHTVHPIQLCLLSVASTGQYSKCP